MQTPKNQYTKENRLFGYVIMNAEGDVLDSINNAGQLHFTPQYMLEELALKPMLFRNRLRLPRNVTDKLDSSHGLLEVRLNEDGKIDVDAVLDGRVIGSVSSVLQAEQMSQSVESGKAFVSRQEMRDDRYREKG